MGKQTVPAGLSAAAKEAIVARAVGDNDTAMDRVWVITGHGDLALYAVLRGWAAFAVSGLPAGGDAELELVGPDGQPIEAAGASPEAKALMWTGRFLAATANDDDATTTALFKVLQEAPRKDGTRAVFAVLDMAAAVMRQILERDGML